MILLLKTFEINTNIEATCKKAAYQKSGYAMEVLGDFYEETHNYEEAIYWYRRAIENYRVAPQYGGATATYALGSLFALAPTKTLRNPKKAATLLLQSVSLGDDSFIGSYLTNTNCKNCLPLATRLYMQTFLKQRGLYTGYLDGDFGENTIKGIMTLYKNPQKYSAEMQHFQRRAHHTLKVKSSQKTARRHIRKKSPSKKKRKRRSVLTVTTKASSKPQNTNTSWLHQLTQP